MKRIALLMALLLSVAGCSNGATEKVWENGIPVSFYFVADTPRGFKLFSEVKNLLAREGDLNLQVVSDLVSGKVAPIDSDYINLWGGTNTVNSVSVADSVATVDLGELSLNVGAESEQRAIDQIVWTLTEFAPDVKSVRFTVNGETVESFAGHVDTTGVFERAIGYEVLNPIQISSINQGAELTSPVTISGQACTFEANVVWKLYQEGTVVQEGFTTASSGCPERGQWSITISDLAPGNYTIAGVEYSAEDGSLFAIDDKDFVIISE
jgi:hypothetical protein